MKYEVSFIVESDDEYSDGEQIEDLRNDIEMTVADYNCFLQIGNVKVAEIGQLMKNCFLIERN